jgi:hypothetical protein
MGRVLNDVGAVSIVDSRTLMRQIQISNTGGGIGGAVYDIRSGSYATDVDALSNTYCNGLCAPTGGTLYCRIGAQLTPVYPASPVDFNTLDDSFRLCPFNVHLVMDARMNITNITYLLAHTRAAIPSGIFTVACYYPSCVLHGSIKFVTNCPGSGETVPTGIHFQGIHMELNSTEGAVMLDFNTTALPAPCVIPILDSITVSASSGFRAMSSGTTGGDMIGIRCDGCLVNTFTVDQVSWYREISTGFIGVLFQPGYGGTNAFRMDRQSMVSGSLRLPTLVRIISPRSFNIGGTSFSVQCITDNLACIHIVGTRNLTGTHTVHDLTLNGAIGSRSVLAFGILWESDQNATSLSSIASSYTDGFLRINTNAGGFPNVGAFSAPNMLTSFYPCVNGSCAAIQSLVVQNPLTPNKGAIQDWVYVDSDFALLSTPLVYPSPQENCLKSREFCEALVTSGFAYNPHHVLIFGAIAVFVLGFGAMWIVFCNGWRVFVGQANGGAPKYMPIKTSEYA